MIFYGAKSVSIFTNAHTWFTCAQDDSHILRDKIRTCISDAHINIQYSELQTACCLWTSLNLFVNFETCLILLNSYMSFTNREWSATNQIVQLFLSVLPVDLAPWSLHHCPRFLTKKDSSSWQVCCAGPVVVLACSWELLGMSSVVLEWSEMQREV